MPSPELDVMFAPSRTYARLASEQTSLALLGAATRPLLAALIIGAVAAMTPTDRANRYRG